MRKRIKKRNKKNKNKNKRVYKSTNLFEKSASKSVMIFIGLLFIFPLLNIAFQNNMTISVELYFMIIYFTAATFAVFLISGFCNNLLIDKVWNSNDVKDSIFNWIGRALLLALLILDLKYYFIPMSLDVPRIITGNYKRISGRIEDIKIKNNAHRTRGQWYEKINYVYFKEEVTGKTIKITFHVTKTDISYSTKNIYYLPHTKWGITTE